MHASTATLPSPLRFCPYALALTVQTVAWSMALTTQGNATEAWHMAARWSARGSFSVFFLVLTYSWFLRHWPKLLGPPSLRRHWGLAFATAHFAHLAALLIYLEVSGVVVNASTRVGGAIAFGLLTLMVATSNDFSRSRLGRGWTWLHRLGVHYLWVVFTISYVKRAQDPERLWIGVFGLLASALALGLRISSWRSELGARRALAVE